MKEYMPIRDSASYMNKRRYYQRKHKPIDCLTRILPLYHWYERWHI